MEGVLELAMAFVIGVMGISFVVSALVGVLIGRR
jgi:hypothetical protein